MENKKVMCKICNSEFYPIDIGINHYIARDSVKTGLAITFSSTEEYKLYDAFDCPVCKCQNILGERKRCNNVFDAKEIEDNDDESAKNYFDTIDKGLRDKEENESEEVENVEKKNERKKPECYGTAKITPECWECFYKWACAKKLESIIIPEIPTCYGECDMEDTACESCDIILSCKKQTLDNVNEKHDKIMDKILGDKNE